MSTQTLQSRHNVSDNLDQMLEKGIEPADLVAVRAIKNGHLNGDGNTLYASPHRPTLHFSLNHIVDINPMYGKWNDADTVILAPFEQMVEANRQNLYGGTTSDIFTVGYAELPEYEIVRKQENENFESFKERVYDQMEELGYKPMPGGNWAWGDSWEATEQIEEVLTELGDYVCAPHANTAFGEADSQTFGRFRYDEDTGEVAIIPHDPESDFAKHTVRRYMHEVAEAFGIQDALVTCPDGTVYYPPIGMFYRDMENAVEHADVPSYEEWFTENLERDGEVGQEPHERVDDSFLRTLWFDNFKSAVDWHAEHERKAADRYKENGNVNDVERAEMHEQYAKHLEDSVLRFAGHINQWRRYWNGK